MQVNKALISKLEKLARLELSENEKKAIQSDLENILGMINKLDEIDLSNVKPLLQVFDSDHQLRTDDIVTPLDASEALKNAPKKQGPYFSVPNVIEKP